MIASVWFETIPAAQVAEARSGKVPLFNWRYSGQSRKNDHDELQRNHVMLVALLERAGSFLLDKGTLNEAARLYDEKMDGLLSKCGSMTVSDQAYCVKLMLRSVNRIARNTVTGSRLAPWLRQLVSVCAQPSDGDDAPQGDDQLALEDGAPKVTSMRLVRRASSSVFTRSASRDQLAPSDSSSALRRCNASDPLVENAPATPQRRPAQQGRRILTKSPGWSTDALCGSPMDVDSPSPCLTPIFAKRSTVTIEDVSSPRPSKQQKGQWNYDWADGYGAQRVHTKDPKQKWIPAVNYVAGPNGFIMADWADGTKAWESEVSNLELEHLDLPALRKPASAPSKRPAAIVCKRPSVAAPAFEAPSLKRPASCMIIAQRPASRMIIAPAMKVLKSSPRKLEHSRVWHMVFDMNKKKKGEEKAKRLAGRVATAHCKNMFG